MQIVPLELQLQNSFPNVNQASTVLLIMFLFPIISFANLFISIHLEASPKVHSDIHHKSLMINVSHYALKCIVILYQKMSRVHIFST